MLKIWIGESFSNFNDRPSYLGIETIIAKEKILPAMLRSVPSPPYFLLDLKGFSRLADL